MESLGQTDNRTRRAGPHPTEGHGKSWLLIPTQAGSILGLRVCLTHTQHTPPLPRLQTLGILKKTKTTGSHQSLKLESPLKLLRSLPSNWVSKDRKTS